MAPFKPRWTKTESKVVQEWIEQDSYSRPLGRFVRCPKCCYSRGCPLASYIYFGLFGCVAFCILCMLCVIIVHPYVHSLKFKKATCTALSESSTGEKTCSCGSNCRSTYSCLQLNVRMTMPDGQMVDTIIFETTANMMEAHPCAFNPVCSLDQLESKEDIRRFNQQYGQTGKKYPCLYNPYKPSQVVVRKMKDNSGIIHAVAWPFLGFLICAVAIIVTFFICGCKFVCIGSPPLEIKDEARRREQGRLWNDRRLSDEQQYLPVQHLEEEGKLEHTNDGPGEAYNPGKTCSYHEAMKYGTMRSLEKDVMNDAVSDAMSDGITEGDVPDGASDSKYSEV